MSKLTLPRDRRQPPQGLSHIELTVFSLLTIFAALTAIGVSLSAKRSTQTTQLQNRPKPKRTLEAATSIPRPRKLNIEQRTTSLEPRNPGSKKDTSCREQQKISRIQTAIEKAKSRTFHGRVIDQNNFGVAFARIRVTCSGLSLEESQKFKVIDIFANEHGEFDFECRDDLENADLHVFSETHEDRTEHLVTRLEAGLTNTAEIQVHSYVAVQLRCFDENEEELLLKASDFKSCNSAKCQNDLWDPVIRYYPTAEFRILNSKTDAQSRRSLTTRRSEGHLVEIGGVSKRQLASLDILVHVQGFVPKRLSQLESLDFVIAHSTKLSPRERLIPTAQLQVKLARGLSLTGLVQTESGAPVKDAKIKLVSAKTQGYDDPTWLAQSDASGRYVIRGLTPGQFFVSVESTLGFLDARVISLQDQQFSNQDLIIKSGR